MLKELINRRKAEQAEKKAFSGRRGYIFKVDLKIWPTQKCQRFKVWQPLPLESSYQGCSGVEFPNLPPKKFLKDPVFKNKVAYWEIQKPNSTLVYRFSQRSKVWVEPRVPKKITEELADYNKNSPEYKLFSQEDPYFYFNDPRLIKIAQQLVKGRKKISEIAQSIYEFVRDNLNYGKPIEGLYSSIDALERPRVDCGGFASLLGGLYRCVGIPARLLSGFLAGYPGEHYHVWLEFMLPSGRWVPADPSLEHLRRAGRDFKPGGFGKVGNDRIVVSIGSNVSLASKRFPFLQLPVVDSVPDSSVKVSRIVEALELR